MPARRLYLTGAIVLVVGLIAAAVIYFLAANQAGTDAAGYNIVGGTAYPITLDESSRALQQVERLGGKPAVLTLKFHRWFLSLWHGRRLACTLAVLSAAVSLLCFHIADLMGHDAGD
ncbi:MAG: hypothetical protein KGQ35_05560 [Burkholderiales bacterium]|nr:hypothetical protein [Burkholderiales bacterium]